MNAALCARLAQEFSGDLLLRVDDADAQRSRPQYRDAISDLVEWLNLPIASVHEHQGEHGERYWAELARLAEAVPEIIFACFCTRSQLDSGETCTCSGAISEWRIHEARICMRIQGGSSVLWRRDGIPAYQLTSVVDDDRLGITHVVRGEDLEPSTLIQREISRNLPGSTFADTWVVHHALVRDESGSKLSKSSGALAAPMQLDDVTKKEVQRLTDLIWESEIQPTI